MKAPTLELKLDSNEESGSQTSETNKDSESESGNDSLARDQNQRIELADLDEGRRGSITDRDREPRSSKKRVKIARLDSQTDGEASQRSENERSRLVGSEEAKFLSFDGKIKKGGGQIEGDSSSSAFVEAKEDGDESSDQLADQEFAYFEDLDKVEYMRQSRLTNQRTLMHSNHWRLMKMD